MPDDERPILMCLPVARSAVAPVAGGTRDRPDDHRRAEIVCADCVAKREPAADELMPPNARQLAEIEASLAADHARN